MTRDEIDELIKYLEKNYYVKCEYLPANEEKFIRERLIVYLKHPPILFCGVDFNKKNITGKLNALDLIRF